MIPFPSLTEENAGEKLDGMMNYFRQHPPKNAGCWSLIPSQPLSLDIKLLARGFQTGWQPSWMSLDLEKINTHHTVPAGLVVKADNESNIDNTKNLPYAGKNGAVSIALMQKQPDRVQRFIGTLNGDVVGHAYVFFSTVENAVAGIYNVGVVPQARQQGVGKAVVTAACQFAKEKGYHYATLNGTGKRMYEQIGFEWISFGLTWWLMNNKYITHPPSADQVAFAEAIGMGDIDTLKKYENKFNAVDFSKPTNNGMILMQLAVHGHQPASAEWLINHGAAYSVLDAWDLHWENLCVYSYVIALAELALSANPMW
jgi:ribosomal protein S18 acetylase RimI-like enzyme